MRYAVCMYTFVQLYKLIYAMNMRRVIRQNVNANMVSVRGVVCVL